MTISCISLRDSASISNERLVMFTSCKEEIGIGKGVERLRVKSWQFSTVIVLMNVCKR